MSKYIIDSTTLTALADAARAIDGNGTKVLSVSMPFYPDALYICAASPYSAVVNYGEIMMVYDLRSFLRYNGINRVAAKNTWNAQVLANTFENRPKYENGVLTLTGATINKHDFVFTATAYTLIAVKYTEKGDKDLLYDTVRALPEDSAYTAQFSQYRVYETMTNEEWLALTAEKPNVEFALV